MRNACRFPKDHTLQFAITAIGTNTMRSVFSNRYYQLVMVRLAEIVGKANVASIPQEESKRCYYNPSCPGHQNVLDIPDPS